MRLHFRLWPILAIVGLGLCAHARILTFAASLLIVDQRDARPWEVVLISSGDGRYDAAAELLKSDDDRRVVHLPRFSRLQHYGVLPESRLHLLTQLRARGVGPEKVDSVGEPNRSTREAFRKLDRYLNQNPQANVVVLCERFSSRVARYELDLYLTKQNARRVRVVGLADRRYFEANWWRSRRGVEEFLNAMLDLTATYWYGREDLPLPPLWKDGIHSKNEL